MRRVKIIAKKASIGSNGDIEYKEEGEKIKQSTKHQVQHVNLTEANSLPTNHVRSVVRVTPL